MVLFFKIILGLIAFLLLFLFGFFCFYSKQIRFNIELNKSKRNYNSLEKFFDYFYGNLYKKTHVLIFKNQFKDTELCEKCKEEKESIKSAEIEDHHNKLNEHIYVEYFRSDDESWLHLAGREGYIFKCKKHNIEVYKMITCLS